MEWIFTDCFDTLLLRKYSPETVKRRWAKDLSVLLGYNLSYQEIYEIRKISESIMPPYYSYMDLCNEIINRIDLCLSCKVSDKNELEDSMYRLELKNEIAGLQVNNEQLQLLKESSAKIAIISDMYCGEAFIWDLLKAFNIDKYIDRVFVSCDYKATKCSLNNSLYGKVLEELQIKAQDAIMYDDTEVCCYCAKQCQIKAVHVNKMLYNGKNNERKIVEKKINELLEKKYSSLESLSNYVAALYLFTERLYKECVKKKIEKVFFLSREGEYLKKLFDTYASTVPSGPKTEYLYVSRRAVLGASFSADPFNPCDLIKKAYHSVGLRSLLNNIGFSNDEIVRIGTLYGIDIEQKIENYWESHIWKILCSDKEFLDCYKCYTDRKKNIFAKYLDQSGFLDRTKIAVVDVGWKGTMQDALISFRHNDESLYGYYIGTTEYAKSDLHNIKTGVLFSAADVRSADYEVWSFYHTQIESLLTASHAGVLSYDMKEKGYVVPVFQEWGSEKMSYEMMLPMQDQIFDKFKCILSVLYQHGYDAEDFYLFFMQVHIKTMLSFGRAKSIFLRQLQYNQIENLVTGQSNSSEMVHSYGLLHNFKRIFRNLDTLHNPVRMIRILQTNNLHCLIPLVIGSVKNQLLKQAKYRK